MLAFLHPKRLFPLIFLIGVSSSSGQAPESTQSSLQATWNAYLQNTPRTPGDAVPVTLPRAIELALTHNRDILGGQIDLANAMQAVCAADARFATRFRPQGTAGIGSDSEQFGYGIRASRRLHTGTEVAVSGGYDNRDSSGFRQERGRLSLELSQPLFRNFGRLMTMEPVVAAGQALRQAKRSFERRKEDLILETVSQYESVLRAERSLEIDRKSVKRLDDFLVLTQSLERQGKGTRIDTLRVEQQFGQAKTRLENARDTLATARQDFNDLIGAPLDALLRLAEPPLLQLQVPRADHATTIALANRMDYAQLLDRIADADRAIRIADKNLKPDLRLTTRYTQQNPLDRDPLELTEDDWFAGITLGSNLNNLEEQIARDRSQLNRRSLDISQADLKYSIAKDVRNHIRAYQTAHSNLRIADRNTTLAADRLELAQTFYRLGQGDNFTLIEAETDYLAAQNQSLGTRADASNSGFRLLRALGILVNHPDDLKPEPEVIAE